MTRSFRDDDTIVAVATAPGIGALSIVRLSGFSAHDIARAVVNGALPASRTAALRALRSRDGEVLDEAVVLAYDGPRSYTGEDSVEIICHGGWVTATRITRALVEAGARPAQAGEFTRRAVLNGRLDLLQAEAVNDLIHSESSASARLALQQLDGGLSRRLSALREDVLGLEALVAYDIDFPEEDDGPIDPSRLASACQAVLQAVEELIATTPGGELVRQGAVVAIVGPPNVGKSSLFNALLGRERALVTSIPGTTRDALEAVLDVMPVPLRLVDTAGIRETNDEVERLGVAVSHSYLKAASAVLACGDNAESLQAAREMARQHATGLVVAVRTKIDVSPVDAADQQDEVIGVSAVSGAGLESLMQHVSMLVAHDAHVPEPGSPVVSHARYRSVLEQARQELLAFERAWALHEVPPTISAVRLREAVRLVEELIGSVDVEEVLGKLFSSFCVGK